MTHQERAALSVVTPYYCFIPFMGDLFISVSLSEDEPRLFWPTADGFEEVSRDEGMRRAMRAFLPAGLWPRETKP